MKTFYIILFLTYTSFNFAQTIDNQSIDSGGVSVTNNGISLLYTVGEVAIQDYSTANNLISEGFISIASSNNTLSTINPNSNIVSLYPNPTKNNLEVSNSLETINKMTIYDINGRTVLSLTGIASKSKSIDTSFLEKGVYVITLWTTNSIETRKFIKL